MDAARHRKHWLRCYADIIHKLWLQQDTRLGIAPDYAHQIEADLAAFYEHPLKRTFIETTYGSETHLSRQGCEPPYL
jgi:hypothetical protein